MALVGEIVLVAIIFVVWNYLATLTVGFAIGIFSRKRIAEAVEAEDSTLMMRRTLSSSLLFDVAALVVAPIGAYFVILPFTAKFAGDEIAFAALFVYALFRLQAAVKGWNQYKRLTPVLDAASLLDSEAPAQSQPESTSALTQTEKADADASL